ncbi:SRPBCC family protein [Streptomyces griseus]|uniref:SRPBCC family protein n=1 Tax=Streptomyces griseus TaxID=1911 RepID=UPI0008406DBD|nr:SRPBCC family protein [Streptomyces griseus]
MSDIADEIYRVHRETGERRGAAGPVRTVLARRVFDAEVAEVWDAVTSPERLRTWFLPVDGDLRAGGRYRIEGSAEGEILACVAPERLRVSWLAGPDPGFSEVELRLAPDGAGRTVLELEHASEVPEEFWRQFGPGAAGVGWDLMLLGLSRHLSGAASDVEAGADWPASPEAKDFVTLSGEAWGAAYAASGADAEVVAATTAATIGFYTQT